MTSLPAYVWFILKVVVALMLSYIENYILSESHYRHLFEICPSRQVRGPRLPRTNIDPGLLKWPLKWHFHYLNPYLQNCFYKLTTFKLILQLFGAVWTCFGLYLWQYPDSKLVGVKLSAHTVRRVGCASQPIAPL